MLLVEHLILNENIINIIHIWRNNEITRKYSKNKDLITYDQMKWILENVYYKCNLKPYIAKIDDKYIGFIGFLNYNNDIYISININPDFRGNGYGSKILKEVLNKIEYGITINAEIIKDNLASIKLFEKCGFKLVNTDDDLLIYQWLK
jgi:RimJ/RimL family protein N-acetyltransferase